MIGLHPPRTMAEAGLRQSNALFQALKPQPADELLALIGQFRADTRPGKIDLGVGVYKDADGFTPVMAAVKQAELFLAERQQTKSYLGPAGDREFVALLTREVFGQHIETGRLFGLQTPGGNGALRLGAELIAAARPAATVWLGTPYWPNHPAILDVVGLTTRTFRHVDPITQLVDFDAITSALSRAAPGDVVLLHGCCHNPTGAGLDAAKWDALADVLTERQLVPFIDLAYHGMGAGLDADAYGARRLAGRAREMLVAYSCDKNFGLYRERTGALFVIADTAETSSRVGSNLLALACTSWAMPPDHGAAAVRIVLESDELTALWRDELAGMCLRINTVRKRLADSHPHLAVLSRQEGMFSMLPVSPGAIAALRDAHAIYMAPNGRVNLAGLRLDDVGPLVAALRAVGALGHAG